MGSCCAKPPPPPPKPWTPLPPPSPPLPTPHTYFPPPQGFHVGQYDPHGICIICKGTFDERKLRRAIVLLLSKQQKPTIDWWLSRDLFKILYSFVLQ